MAVYGRSDEDQIVKIEEVGPRHGIVVHLSRVMWLHLSLSSSLSKTGGPDMKAGILL